MAFNNEMLSYFANKMWSKNKDTFVSKETGKSLSTNDYTNEDKNKLDNLSAKTTTYDNTDSGLSSTNVQGAIDEINTKLSTKSDSTHNHDDRYYTETEIDNKLSTKSDTSHTHDSSYYKKSEVYTKTETDNKIEENNIHKSLSIATVQGVHGIRYYESNLEVYNAETEEWEKAAGGGLPPRPVTNVSAKEIFITGGKGTLTVSWTLPSVYDVQIGKINIYGYSGETEPTDISQFVLISSVKSTDSSAELEVTQAYDYILVTTVSTDEIIQEDLNQMSSVLSHILPAEGTTFANMSWGDVKKVADAGFAESYFNIGAQKTISINGKNYLFEVGDFKHDDKADGTGKAPLTILLKNCLATKYAMNNPETNSGGWESCAVRSTLQGTIYNQLPQEVRDVICPVKKKTSAGSQSNTINTTTDTLFLLSEVEVFGSTKYSVAGEGSQYPIFTDNNSRIKKLGDSGSVFSWWLRSPRAGHSTHFCFVGTDGSATNYSSNVTFGVCFGFCI